MAFQGGKRYEIFLGARDGIVLIYFCMRGLPLLFSIFHLPLYINTNSNHPPSLIKAVPEEINNRLSQLSSDEQIFKNAIPIYQESLRISGYKYDLKFKPTAPCNRDQEKRKIKRNITWFNCEVAAMEFAFIGH